MVSGFYNHYDDPDEFWDEEPLAKPSGQPSPGTVPTFGTKGAVPPDRADSQSGRWQSPGPSHSLPVSTGAPLPTPYRDDELPTFHEQSNRDAAEPTSQVDHLIDTWNLRGSSLVAMQVDGGLVPTNIDVDGPWSRSAHHREYEAELLKAYDLAVLRKYQQILSTKRSRPDGSLDLECGVPDRRTQLAVLLETSGWVEYQHKLDAMIASTGYSATGPTMHRNGPAVSMAADRTRITSIAIAANWTDRVDPRTVIDEILRCADQIRALRPRFTVWGNYSQYSVEDLEFQHDQHVKSLQEQASYPA